MAVEDRRVHAEGGDVRIVRYDRAGKWFLEYEPANLRPCQQLTLNGAVTAALELEADGGTIHLGRPGGTTFDRKVAAARAS